MMAAEQWYQYQENYKRYGFDMKPRAEKKERIKPKESALGITAKDKTRLILLTFFIGILCIGLILATAYAASIKFSNNALIKENAVIQGEIENLNVKIESGTNIQILESKAVTELGMVYPNSEQKIYLGEIENDMNDFALVLKEQAYN